MKTLGVGLIGSGFMGRTNAETVKRYLEGARLVAVTGGSRAASLAQEYGAEAEPDLDAFLARPDIDVVIISTPHAAHSKQAIAAAKAGKHILLDKPMATSVADCDRILDAAKLARVKLMIMFGQRFRDCNIEAHRLVRAGAIGQVTMIQEQILAVGGLSSLPSWQSLPENVGILLGHAVHNIDRIRWITGAEIVSVSAQVQRDQASGNDVSVMALLSLTSGAMATLWASWAIASPAFPHTASRRSSPVKPAISISMPTANCASGAAISGPWHRYSNPLTGPGKALFRLSEWKRIAASTRSSLMRCVKTEVLRCPEKMGAPPSKWQSPPIKARLKVA